MPTAPTWHMPTPWPWPPPVADQRRHVAAGVAREVEHEHRRLQVAERAADLELAADLLGAAVADEASRVARPETPRSRTTEIAQPADAGARLQRRARRSASASGSSPAPPWGARTTARRARGRWRATHAARRRRWWRTSAGARRAAVGVEPAAQGRVGRAAPHVLVVLAVAAAGGGVDRVDEAAGVFAHEELPARGLHGGGGARVFAAGAGVDLAVLRRAEPIGIGEVARAELGEELVARGDCLRLERLGRRRRRHLRGHEAGQQLVLGDRVDDGELSRIVDGDVESCRSICASPCRRARCRRRRARAGPRGRARTTGSNRCARRRRGRRRPRRCRAAARRARGRPCRRSCPRRRRGCAGCRAPGP